MHKIILHILFNRPSNTQQLVNMETREWQCSKCWRTVQAVVNCSIFVSFLHHAAAVILIMVSLSVLLLNFWHASLAAVCFNHRLPLQPWDDAHFTGRKKLHLGLVFSPCYAINRARYFYGNLSVRPSVCVWRWGIVVTDWNTLKIISWLISLGFLLSASWIGLYYKRNTRNFRRNKGGVDNLIWISS